MKTINRIQYFLFAIILLGMFASFAQNDYSFILLSYPYLFIGLLFFIEIFYSFKELDENKSSAIYSIIECFGLGLFFCGTFFAAMHWMGATIILIIGSLFLLFLYTGLGVRTILKYFKEGNRMFFVLFCLAACTCLAIVAFTFKFQNWSFARVLAVLSVVISFVFLLLFIFNIKFNDGKEKIGFRYCLRQIKTRLILSYVFFSFWTVYLTLASFGIAPKLYSLANPPALEKLYQEQNPAANIYWKNYQQFLDNRIAATNNQQEYLNSPK